MHGSWNEYVELVFCRLDQLGMEALISRLVLRHLHLMAVRICEYLEMPSDSVLVHWACQKVVMSDLAVCQPLEIHPWVPFRLVRSWH